MSQQLSSISAIVVVRDYVVDMLAVEKLSARLSKQFSDTEVILVANGVSAQVAIVLKEASQRLPDCTVLFLSEDVHDDLARLVGIDHAISDFVLFATPLQAEIDALPLVVDALRSGHELVIGEGEGGIKVQRDLLASSLFAVFRWIYRLTNGQEFEEKPPMFRVFSRGAALYVSTRNNGEVLVRARSLGQGFPSTTLSIGSSPPMPARGIALRMGLAKGFRLMLTGSALPLRISSFLGFVGGIASVLYAVYVVAIYLFKSTVEPGWTTLSLQSAGMMFLFSLQFLFLSEYVVQILSTSPMRSRRQLVARELRSPLSRRSSRLNVVDGAGQFQLGAPSHLLKTDLAL